MRCVYIRVQTLLTSKNNKEEDEKEEEKLGEAADERKEAGLNSPDDPSGFSRLLLYVYYASIANGSCCARPKVTHQLALVSRSNN